MMLVAIAVATAVADAPTPVAAEVIRSPSTVMLVTSPVPVTVMVAVRGAGMRAKVYGVTPAAMLAAVLAMLAAWQRVPASAVEVRAVIDVSHQRSFAGKV